MAKELYFVKKNGGFYSVVQLKNDADPKAYEQRMADKGIAVLKCKGKPPSAPTLLRYSDGISKATDGCKVEPDGVCIHGHPSWLLALNYI